MDTWIAELRADHIFLQLIEAHLLAGDFNALVGEEREEHVFDAFCRILPERFVQDPRIISVDVKPRAVPSD